MHTSWLSEQSLLQLDRPEAMTEYKLFILIKGIMILVLYEKSFKSMEADYSNSLASPLVASWGESSPSLRIRYDKIKLSCQRCQFLGTQKQATPKERHTYLQPVQRELASDKRSPCYHILQPCFSWRIHAGHHVLASSNEAGSLWTGWVLLCHILGVACFWVPKNWHLW